MGKHKLFKILSKYAYKIATEIHVSKQNEKPDLRYPEIKRIKRTFHLYTFSAQQKT